MVAGIGLGAACVRSGPEAPLHRWPPDTGIDRIECGSSDRLCLVFRNEMSDAFEVDWVGFWLDDALVFARGGHPALLNVVVYSGSPPPGQHRLQFLLRMRGGAKSLAGYHFEARSSHTFDVPEVGPAPARLVVVAYEKGAPPTTPLEERPAVRYVDPPQAPHDRVASQGKGAAQLPTAKIWVSKTGEGELNGQSADLMAVTAALDDLARRQGLVLYAPEISQGDMPPNAARVIVLIAQRHLPVVLGTKRDLSDARAEGSLR
jgi:hypothetical protein